ncbi:MULTISPECIES: hypothetical protein [Mesonia]|uniref:Uncharacterized protein n=1 Tax=Mesonia oceanica TaxID=2687242 RepID=A0AC61Y676_9FLAO|nr:MULTISPECIES: hypothetical protein [Mesonia]MAN26188.1 hypothetical protein [Mesonia sp.]MAQ42620.1 hypothetical protein [Mesonia sp.]VVU99843.1 hypothetical protein FVB9532_01104 [Mesonia oceanica]|tara:strand:+ start:5961 stop:6176 length:216 start_codon:yes stop_codon:yes gene_type:complete
MKRTFLTLSFICGLLAFTSCREETKTKEVVREVEVKEKKEEKGILERAGEKVDSEVNKEIDKKIDEIGDDN